MFFPVYCVFFFSSRIRVGTQRRNTQSFDTELLKVEMQSVNISHNFIYEVDNYFNTTQGFLLPKFILCILKIQVLL